MSIQNAVTNAGNWLSVSTTSSSGSSGTICLPSITTTTVSVDDIGIDNDIVDEIIKLASTKLVKIGYKKDTSDSWASHGKYKLYDSSMTDLGFITVSSTHIQFLRPNMVWSDTLDNLTCELGDPKAIEKIAQHIKSKYESNVKHNFIPENFVKLIIFSIIMIAVGLSAGFALTMIVGYLI